MASASANDAETRIVVRSAMVNSPVDPVSLEPLPDEPFPPDEPPTVPLTVSTVPARGLRSVAPSSACSAVSRSFCACSRLARADASCAEADATELAEEFWLLLEPLVPLVSLDAALSAATASS